MKEHTVRSFEQELRHVERTLGRMGALAAAQLERACEVLAKGGDERAERTVEGDADLDGLELEVSSGALRLLALRQPMAVDLRQTIGAVKIAADLERVGDLAKSIAKRGRVVHHQPQPRTIPPALLEMGRFARLQLHEVMEAWGLRDAERARQVWRGDARLDDWYESLFRELLTYMMEDPRSITAQTHLLFVAKNLERVGDHCANVAATVIYVVEGAGPTGSRPKGADARMSVVEPPPQPERRSGAQSEGERR